MNNQDKTSSGPQIEGTRVDLGEDLLEKTAVLGPLEPGPPPVKVEVSASQDLLESARILLGEGLMEDAKKILHQILIKDQGHLPARQLLEKLHEQELKQIFGEGSRRSYQKKAEVFVPTDSEQIMKQLDADLGLGVFAETVHEVALSELSLFQDDESMEKFSAALEKDLANAPAQDWIDLGIGFLEMDLYSVAIRLFTGATRKIDPANAETYTLHVSSISLLALALILTKRPFEAVSKIQPILHDMEIRPNDKLELYYLMGRTYESLQKMELAQGYYQQVKEIDPDYRDVEQRLLRKNVR